MFIGPPTLTAPLIETWEEVSVEKKPSLVRLNTGYDVPVTALLDEGVLDPTVSCWC